MYDGHGVDDRLLLKRQYFDVSSMRSDCTSLSSLVGLHFGRFIVFSMVFAISALRQREKLVVVLGHKLGDVALVTTLTSIISTFCSELVSPDSLLLFVVDVSFVGELSSDDVFDVFVGFSFFSLFCRYLPPTSLPFKYETAGLVVLNEDRLLKLLTCSLFELRGYSLL